MLKYFKKSVLAYLDIVAAILCLILAIYGPISKGFAAHTFEGVALLFLIISVLVSLAAFFLDFSWTPIVATLFVGAAFAILFYFSLPIFADHANDLNFQNGDYAVCLTYVVMGAIALVTSIVACFDPKK